MVLRYFIVFCITILGCTEALPSCPDLTPSIVFYADPENCANYYECYGGILTHMECPPHLYWNDRSDSCDYANNVDCGSRPTPTPSTSSTTSAPTSTTPTATTPTSTPSTQPTTSAPTSTTQSPTTPTSTPSTQPTTSAPTSTTQSPTTPTPTPSTTSTTSAPTSTTPTATTPSYDPDPQCPPSSKTQIVFFPDPSNCQQYFECNRGVRFTMICPDSLLYNVQTEACDYPDEVDCSGRSPPLPTSTTPVSTTSSTSSGTTALPTTPNYDPDPQCIYTAGTEFFPDPSNCKQYFECDEGERFTRVCPDNLLYNVAAQACDYPENVDCSGRSTSVTSSTSTTPVTTPSSTLSTTTSAPTTPNYDPDPKCTSSTEIQFFPDPSNCQQYFECDRGVRFTMVCPENLLYNVVAQVCDYPEQVDCSGRSTSVTSSTSTTPVTTPSSTLSTTTSAPTTPNYDPDPKCTSTEIQFFPDPSNCQQYFECDRGVRFTMVCPENLLYNVVSQACDYPEQVDCSGRSTPTHPSTTPTATTPTEVPTTLSTMGPNGACKDKADGDYVGDHADCTIFYECLGGSGLPRRCGNNLNWCQEELTCDIKDKPGCTCY